MVQSKTQRLYRLQKIILEIIFWDLLTAQCSFAIGPDENIIIDSSM